MTHTFMKHSDGSFSVGNWVQGAHHARFEPLVKVQHLTSAIRLTNLLNGGTGNVEATLLRAGVMTDVAGTDSNGEDHESTAKSAAMVRRARGRAVARHTV